LDAAAHGAGGNLVYDWKGQIGLHKQNVGIPREKMEELKHKDNCLYNTGRHAEAIHG